MACPSHVFRNVIVAPGGTDSCLIEDERRNRVRTHGSGARIPGKGISVYMDLEHGPARTLDELEQAYSLVYEKYLSLGYCDPHFSRMRYSLNNSLPAAVTFVSRQDGVVTATVSLLPDSPLGLPLDGAFAAQADELRSQGRRLAEVGMLADHHDFESDRAHRILDLLRLFKLVFDYCRHVGVDDMLVTCNPHHDEFYRRYLSFQGFGAQASLPSVEGAPASLFRIDMRQIEKQDGIRRSVRALFFGETTPPDVFEERYRLDEAAFSRFFVELRPLLPEAQGTAAAYIQSLYPEIDVEALRHQVV